EAARAIRGRACALPFVPAPVAVNARLARAIRSAFRLDGEPLGLDGLIVHLAEALLDADPSSGPPRTVALDGPALDRARRFLDAETGRVIRSVELEAITGLGRYELARQFRAAFGTSPYRYSLLRRLDRARTRLHREPSLADLALAAGFADQAHLSRQFRAAFGVTPGRYRALAAAPLARRSS
ncbi:MAG TPA: AraC family transcriptional regulator, partial [Candidatus Bathyarchaeia archaeon]|nr:AraC family transcriptional regulator [Candidatus Bathyarchaeia archaeon]